MGTGGPGPVASRERGLSSLRWSRGDRMLRIVLGMTRRGLGMQNRSSALDAVRVVGIIAIVVGHVASENLLMRATLYPWHVAVFFVISGYLWKNGRPFSDEIRRRTRTLALPYAFWLVVISVPFVALSGRYGSLTGTEALAYVVGGSHLGRPFSAFWFIGALYAACLLLRAIEPFPALYLGRPESLVSSRSSSNQESRFFPTASDWRLLGSSSFSPDRNSRRCAQGSMLLEHLGWWR